MSIWFKQVQVKNDRALCIFKRDIPTFQFTGFSKEDAATSADMRALLKAVVTLADWADDTTVALSDHYPAKHDLKPCLSLRRGGLIRLPIDPRNFQDYVTYDPQNKTFVVPALWYREGQTQVLWGRLESAIREILRVSAL